MDGNVQNDKKAVLYGIGVGPGDPDLMTVRAVNILKQVDVVFAASSSKNDFSLALGAAEPYLQKEAEVIRLSFPMTKNADALQKAWRENAGCVEKVVQAGKSAAFLTLGDPLLYSTFGYLFLTLKETAQHIDIEIVPGITSMQAAAAEAKMVLTLAGESLSLISGTDGEEEIAGHLAASDSVVILKAYKNFAELRKLVESHAPHKDVMFASCLGSDRQLLTRDLESLPAVPHYLSLLLIANRRSALEPCPKKKAAKKS